MISPITGQTLRLDDEVAALLERRQRGTVVLTGRHGAGKSTAITHLAAVFGENPGLELHDADELGLENAKRLVVCCRNSAPRESAAVYALAPWGDDELLEYLVAAHPECCQSVLSRIRATEDKAFPAGNPELWRLVLDQFARDESLVSVRQALQATIDALLTDRTGREEVARWCLGFVEAAWRSAAWNIDFPFAAQGSAWRRLLWHLPIALLCAADGCAHRLAASNTYEERESRLRLLERKIPAVLITEVGHLIRHHAPVIQFLRNVLEGRHLERHSVAGSLLCAAGADWCPKTRILEGRWRRRRKDRLVVPDLQGAELPGVQWAGASLSQINLRRANLTGANLGGADFNGANLTETRLEGANLSEARLGRLVAHSAVLSGANLARVSGVKAAFVCAEAIGASFEEANLKDADFFSANLERANLHRANLTRAKLGGATIVGADFSQADLSGASLSELPLRLANVAECRFVGANLAGCDLEGVSLTSAEFERAKLAGALLTESVMPRANFYGADLVNAGLAGIEWEQADLRKADLRGASFHLGSCRSGLVGSSIASYGSRTGFYTDDFNAQDYKPPEEIRKANLRGADLRGATIEGVDFYLVDLRDARFDPEQENQLRETGAILESRVR